MQRVTPSYISYISLSQNGQHLLTLTSVDLLAAGYTIATLLDQTGLPRLANLHHLRQAQAVQQHPGEILSAVGRDGGGHPPAGGPPACPTA